MKSDNNERENSYHKIISISFFQLAFLPFALAMDSWRWKLFEGDIDAKK